MLAVAQSALSDIRSGLRLRRVWIAFAGEDIGDQHKNTILGPLWLLLNYLAFAGVFIFIFNISDGTPNYAAHVATGLLVWFYIMETLNLSVSLFVREASFIKGTTLPLTVYVMRLAMQSAIRAAYASIGCLAIFAFLGAYFPDSQFIVANIMRVGMFLTPVFWSYDGSNGIRHIFYWWNPFTYFLDVVRVPIVSGEFPAYPLAVCATICIVAWAFAIALLGRYRKQVVFML